MFNLFRSREKVVRIFLIGILSIVAVSMVMYLIPGFMQTGVPQADDPVLFEVGGQRVTSQVAQQEFQRDGRAGQIPQELMAAYFPQYIEAKMQRMAAAYEAGRMGLTVTDDEVLDGLRSATPQFFQNGALTSRDQFEQYLNSQGFTLQDAIDSMREDIMVKKLEDATLEGIVVTPQEVEQEFKNKYEKAKISYIAFPAAKFMDQVKPTEEDLRKAYEFNKANYTVPAKFAFQVLVLDQDKVEASINLSDAELRSAYASSLDNFRMPERLHVRHILISTQGKSDAEKKALRAKAEDVLKQLKNGADFGELAKKYSDDKGNAEKGGDLDWIVKGQMVPEFENAVFALKPKETSGIITSEYGYHIAQVMDREPARVKPFDEVKAGLAADLKKQMVADKIQMLGDQIHDALQKAPTSAADVAKKFGADLVTVPKGAAGEAIPTLGSSPEIDGALASMKPNDVSPVLVLPANRLAVAVLNSKTPARAADFNDVVDQVRQNYTLDAANKMAEEKAKEAADRIRKGEDMAQVAKSMKLEVTTSSYFGRSDAVEGLGSAVYVADAFTKPEGTVLGPTPIQGREVISKVLGKLDADPTALAAERQALQAALKTKKAQERRDLLLDSILTKLLQQGKAKRYDDNLRRVAASLQK